MKSIALRIPQRRVLSMAKKSKPVKKTVLFLCTHNSARSQMAEGLVNTLYAERYAALSAGVQPTEVNPYAVEVMKELGIDLSKHRSKSITEFQGQEFDYVVTVCDNARETCPFFPGKTVLHQSFEDPAAVHGDVQQILSVFREVRDQIRDWLERVFAEE